MFKINNLKTYSNILNIAASDRAGLLNTKDSLVVFLFPPFGNKVKWTKLCFSDQHQLNFQMITVILFVKQFLVLYQTPVALYYE